MKTTQQKKTQPKKPVAVNTTEIKAWHNGDKVLAVTMYKARSGLRLKDANSAVEKAWMAFMSKTHKGVCDKKKRCAALTIVLHRHGFVGIQTAVAMNWKTGAARTLLVYRKSPKDKVIVISYCPFCGTNLEKAS